MGVEQLRADNDLVDGDGSLDCVVLESSSKHSTLDVRAGEPFSHLVGSGLLVAHGSDSEVISQVSVAVAIVGGLDDFDVMVVITLEFWQRHPLWVGGNVVFGNR